MHILITHTNTSYSVVHVDEESTKAYHYSCVLYLSKDSEYKGGNFVFTDPDPKGFDQRILTREAPVRGNAVMFSSGWENVHYVDAVTEGERWDV
jgi:predicted 2-oxoglutarate/Fe(II)-dependent dioxygenase YbiX